MTRTIAREIASQIIFSSEFLNDDINEIAEKFLNDEYFITLKDVDSIYSSLPNKQRSYILNLVSQYKNHREIVNSYIEKYSKSRKINRISKSALAILRTAICEILYCDDVSDAVAINCAVEIDKSYDDVETVSFVNGILGSIVKDKDTNAK